MFAFRLVSVRWIHSRLYFQWIVASSQPQVCPYNHSYSSFMWHPVKKQSVVVCESQAGNEVRCPHVCLLQAPVVLQGRVWYLSLCVHARFEGFYLFNLHFSLSQFAVGSVRFDCRQGGGGGVDTAACNLLLRGRGLEIENVFSSSDISRPNRNLPLTERLCSTEVYWDFKCKTNISSDFFRNLKVRCVVFTESWLLCFHQSLITWEQTWPWWL